MYCKRTEACRSLRSWASKSGGENMQFLYKYEKISLFGQIRQQEASCTPGFVEQRTCMTKWRESWGGQPPLFEKHGQGSEHTSFLTVDRLFFAIVLALQNCAPPPSPPPPPPPGCKTRMKIRTHMSSCTPLMDLYCNVCAMCLLYQIALICSMPSLPRGANTRILNIRF